MDSTVNISDKHYQVNKRFHPIVVYLSDYLVKTVGVDHEVKKKDEKKLKEGKRPGRSMRTSIFHHLLRRAKKKFNFKKNNHENAKPL